MRWLKLKIKKLLCHFNIHGRQIYPNRLVGPTMCAWCFERQEINRLEELNAKNK